MIKDVRMTVFCVYGRSLKDVKTFSWLQEEVSINIANEIENCLLLRSVKVIVYGLPPEDVASYRSKMIHLIEVRCIIFQRMPVQLVFYKAFLSS